MRGKGAFQEENISLPNMRYARQARDFIYSDVGRRPMREGYQLEETYIENVSGGGWTHQIVGLVADGFHSCVFTDYYFERFNKAEKDFPTLLEYNNYLEEVEDISKSNTLSSLMYFIRFAQLSIIYCTTSDPLCSSPSVPNHVAKKC